MNLINAARRTIANFITPSPSLGEKILENAERVFPLILQQVDHYLKVRAEEGVLDPIDEPLPIFIRRELTWISPIGTVESEEVTLEPEALVRAHMDQMSAKRSRDAVAIFQSSHDPIEKKT